MGVPALARALAVQTLVLRWRPGTAPLSSISPISATPLASLARGLCSNFNLKDAHALPSRRRRPQQPASPTFSQSTHFIIIAPLRGKWTRFETGSPSGFHQRENEANVFGDYPLPESKVAPSLGICRLCSICCAALFWCCCFISHPTRKPSLQGGGGKSAGAECGKLIASRIRLGDRAAPHMY